MPKSFPAAELEAALGASPVGAEPITGGGYGSNTKRWRVELDDGRTAFVKLALDVVFWLPSLRLEGGPEPWAVVPDTRGLAALSAGYFASRARLPTPETAPRVRPFQRAQAEVALPWAATELGLPPP